MAEARKGGLRQRRDARLVRDIGFDRNGIPAACPNLPGLGFCRLAIDVGEHHGITAAHQRVRDPQPDSPGTASDDGRRGQSLISPAISRA